MDFKLFLQQIFKPFNFFWLPTKGGHCCSEGFWQFWGSVYTVFESGGIGNVRQLLKGLQKTCLLHLTPGCSHCETVADLWNAPIFVFLKCLKEARRRNFLNSCQHVRTIFCVWINWVVGLIDGASHFRMSNILKLAPYWFLLFHVCNPDSSRNCFRLCPYLWVQEAIVLFGQSSQNAGFRPADFLGQN